MSLPKGWIKPKLGEVTTYKKGKKPKILKDIQEKDMIPYIDIKAFEKGIIRQYADIESSVLVDEKDFLIVWDGARSGLTGRNMSGSLGSTIMKVDALGFDSDYMYRFFQFKYADINSNTKGTGIPHVDPAYLWNINIPIAPLNEQKRIAKKLDELLAIVENIKTRLDKAPSIIKRFRQSILAAATSGKLTEEWREENPQVDNASELLLEEIGKVRKELLEKEASDGNSESKRLLSKINKHEFKMPAKELPKGWIWASFMESMERVVDCHNKTAPYKESGIPLIRTTDIRNGLIKLEHAKFIDQDTYDYWSRRCPPKEGDLIFTREAPMGEIGIVPENTTLCMGQRMMLLRPLHKYILNKYMLFNIMNPTFQQEMKGSALGATVQHLRVGDVEKLVFPLCPLEEQKEIVSKVESLFALADTLEKKIEAAKKRVDKLTQSILAKAFKGELVPQDPNDESAEELLKRIKSEKDKGKVKKTRKKK